MRLTNALVAGAVAAMAFTACTSLDDNSTWEGQNGNVKFTSYISKRASGTTWANGDKVGIYMKANGTDLGATAVANRQYVTDDRGNFTAESADDAIAYPESGTVDFVAYYPFTANVTGTSLPVSVADQTSLPAIDLLYSNNQTNVSASSEAVNLGFKHQLSHIVLNIKADATIASTTDLKVTLNGAQTNATFNLADGVLSLDAATADIALNVNAAGTKAEAILLPASMSAVKMTFVVGGKTKEVAFPESVLEKGASYSIPVTLRTEGGAVYVSFGAATIEDWTNIPGGSVDVDFGEGGGTVDPDPNPNPGTGEEVTIFYETMGATAISKVNSKWPYLSDYTEWVSGLTFTDVNSTLSARRISDTNNIWFPANKDNDLKITGFSTSGYTKLVLSYDLAANLYNKNEQQDVAAMKGTFNGQSFVTPSRVLSNPDDKDKFYTFTVELPASAAAAASELHFISGADNTKGLRLTNIKLVGTK